ncbi:MAG: pyrroline-5-carboxylate reductase [Planctomycetota bacterium]
MTTYTLGMIGAGNMAEAIARGAVDRGVVPAERLLASDPSEQRLEVFRGFGVASAESNTELVASCEAVLLAVKPQTLTKLGEIWQGFDCERQTVISIMAGLSSDRIAAAIGQPARVVRVMPNTPLMIGRGMSGVALGTHARPGDDALAMKLFGACGEAIRVRETELDAVTAVSGSGPAYLFYLAEAMQDAANQLGLSEQARLLVSQTLWGASELFAASPDSASDLRRKVTSPGGTTAAAIASLDRGGVREAVVAALRAARDRSVELGG